MRTFFSAWLTISVALCTLTNSGAAQAGPLDFTVDSSLSSLNVGIYINGRPEDGGVILTEPQSPGSDTTSLGGLLRADLGGGASITFPGGSNVTFANQPIDQLPDVGGGPSPGDPGPPAPAQYGLNVVLLDAGPVALRDAIADVTSGLIPLVLGSFDSSMTTLGTLTGSADFNLTGAFPTSGTSSLAGQSGTNGLGVGTVVILGNLATITLPVSVDVPVSVSGLTLDAIFTGQIVATAIVREPSSLVLAGMGLLAPAVVILRRRRIR